MLVLKRREGESIFIGNAKVTVTDVDGQYVRLGVEAPRNVPVYRQELLSPGEQEALEAERRAEEAEFEEARKGLRF